MHPGVDLRVDPVGEASNPGPGAGSTLALLGVWGAQSCEGHVTICLGHSDGCTPEVTSRRRRSLVELRGDPPDQVGRIRAHAVEQH